MMDHPLKRETKFERCVEKFGVPTPPKNALRAAKVLLRIGCQIAQDWLRVAQVGELSLRAL